MNSLIVRALKSLFTINTVGAEAVSAMPAKSRVGLYGSLGESAADKANEEVL